MSLSVFNIQTAYSHWKKHQGPKQRPTNLLCNKCFFSCSSANKQIITHFEFQHQIHPLLAKRVDVIENESDDYVNTIAFVSGDAVLRDK